MTMHDVNPNRQFDLHTILLWFMPYAALCFAVLRFGRQEISTRGVGGIPLLSGPRFAAIALITVVFLLLVWEDRRARRREREEAAPRERDGGSPW
jgi:hypothetical protein